MALKDLQFPPSHIEGVIESLRKTVAGIVDRNGEKVFPDVEVLQDAMIWPAGTENAVRILHLRDVMDHENSQPFFITNGQATISLVHFLYSPERDRAAARACCEWELRHMFYPITDEEALSLWGSPIYSRVSIDQRITVEHAYPLAIAVTVAAPTTYKDDDWQKYRIDIPITLWTSKPVP